MDKFVYGLKVVTIYCDLNVDFKKSYHFQVISRNYRRGRSTLQIVTYDQLWTPLTKVIAILLYMKSEKGEVGTFHFKQPRFTVQNYSA